MSDLRLIVAGAGGRMGRTLVRAIAETDGVVLAGALEDERSPMIGQDAAELAGIGANQCRLSAAVNAKLADAEGVVDFTVPAATVALAAVVAQAGKMHVAG